MKCKWKIGILLLLVAIVLFSVYQNQNKIRHSVSGEFFEKGDNYLDHTEKYNVVKAEKYYKISIFIDSKYPIAHYQLGRIHFLNGKFDEAITEFDKELANYPESLHPLYMRGLTNGYAKRYDEGIENFKRYIAWNPKTWAGYNDLVWIFLLKKDYQGAEEFSRKGLENSPGNPWLLSNLGIALLNQERYTEAKENLILAQKYSENLSGEDWAKVYPGNSPEIAESGAREMKAIIFLNLATVDKKLNLKEETRGYYQKYLELLPENDKRRSPIDDFMITE